MTTVDRIESILSRSWTSQASETIARDYVGRHRARGVAQLTFHRMFYVARHLVHTTIRRAG